MNIFINHKTHETIETEMSVEEALKLLPADSTFAMDLKKKYEQTDGSLSENQMYWIMKLAAEVPKVFPCDTAAMFELLAKGKLKVKFHQFDIDMTIYPSGDIWLNGSKFGKYTKTGISCPADADPIVLNKFLLVFCEEGPTECMDRLGKATGVCCYCGLTLTHSISISLGRGPTCSDKRGLYFPHAEYQKTLK